MKTEETGTPGIVIYTDGSAKPNPGFSGSGIHAYRYLKGDGIKPTKIKNWVATDRGYVLESNLSKEKGSTPVKILEYIDIARGYEMIQTNNFGELMAMVTVFEEMAVDMDAAPNVLILADSQYVLNGLTNWCHAWRRNNWMTKTGVPPANMESWKRALMLYEAAVQKYSIELDWVRGHNEDLGNEHADKLAAVGANISRHLMSGEKNITDIFVNRYDKHVKVDKPESHHLLDMTRIYFNSDAAWNESGVYFQGGIEIGRRSGEAEFSVLILDEPDQLVEKVKQAHYENPSEMNTVMFTRGDRIFNNVVANFINRYGKFCMRPQGHVAVSMDFVDAKPLSFELKATELPLRTIEAFNIIGEYLEVFRDQGLEEKSTPYQENISLELEDLAFTSVDLTDYFYNNVKFGNKGETRKELRKEFGVGQEKTTLKATIVMKDSTTLTCPNQNIHLFFGKDLPNRNTLKRIEKDDPRVFVITWKVSPTSYRYATVVKVRGALGIWANYYASQVFLKP